jgi:hypothetical protein
MITQQDKEFPLTRKQNVTTTKVYQWDLIQVNETRIFTTSSRKSSKFHFNINHLPSYEDISTVSLSTTQLSHVEGMEV